MKYKVMLLICLLMCFISGCGNEQKLNPEESTLISTGNDDIEDQKNADNQESIKDQAEGLQNGEEVVVPLTDLVKLDAVVDIPENGVSDLEICKIKLNEFDTEDMAEKIYPEFLSDDWDVREEDGRLLCSNEQGDSCVIDSEIFYQTDHWYTISSYFPIYATNGEATASAEENAEDFSFAARSDVVLQSEQWLEETIGLGEVSFNKIYSVNYQDMQALDAARREEFGPEGMGKLGESVSQRVWSEEDNCYLLSFSRMIDGLPILDKRYNRKDEAYLPTGEIVLGYTQNGLEEVYIQWDYEVLEKRETELCSMETVYRALKGKFEKTISSDEIVIDEMKLIYFPHPVSDESRVYEFVPTWQFTFKSQDLVQRIYIDGISGKEITA